MFTYKNIDYIVDSRINELCFGEFEGKTYEEIKDLYPKQEKEFNLIIEAVKNTGKTLVMVTNEVGLGVVPEYRLGRIFRDLAGTINQGLAALSHEVYLVTCGIPLKIKG